MSQQKLSRQQVVEKRTQRRRQQRMQLIIGITIGAVLVAGLFILLTMLPHLLAGAADQDIVETYYEGISQSVERSGTGIGYALGELDAPVTLVEYSDFSCINCFELSTIIHRLIDEYVKGGELRIVFKPITFVSPTYSVPAGKAAVCAGEQGRFWEMHDQLWHLYETNGRIPSIYLQDLTPVAVALGLDEAAFTSCLNSAQSNRILAGVSDEAQARGVTFTPAIFVNGKMVGYTGVDSYYDIVTQAIDAELNK